MAHNNKIYDLGHLSLAARSGAFRIGSTDLTGRIESVAFLNLDGSKGLNE